MEIYTHTYIYIHRLIGLVGRVFANDPEDLGSIPDRVIPKTFKMVLETSLLNTCVCLYICTYVCLYIYMHVCMNGVL